VARWPPQTCDPRRASTARGDQVGIDADGANRRAALGRDGLRAPATRPCPGCRRPPASESPSRSRCRWPTPCGGLDATMNSPAARASAPTWSTPGSPCRNRRSSARSASRPAIQLSLRQSRSGRAPAGGRVPVARVRLWTSLDECHAGAGHDETRDRVRRAAARAPAGAMAVVAGTMTAGCSCGSRPASDEEVEDQWPADRRLMNVSSSWHRAPGG